MEKNIVWNRYYLSILLFVLIIFLFFPKGIILMGDWTTPASEFQLEKYLHPYTWNNHYNNGINSSHHLAALPFKLIVYFLGKIVPIDYLNFLLFLLIQFLGFYSVNKFFRFLKFDSLTVLIISILYPLNPINYNFIIFGWVYAVIAINILPLAIYFWLRSFKNNIYIYKLLLTILFFSFQSQAILWLLTNLIIFSILYSEDIINLNKTIFNFVLVFLSYFVINSFWILPLFFGENSYLVNSQNLGLENVSIGQDFKWNLFNSSQLLNSTFNSHFSSNLGILKNIMLLIPFSFLINIYFNKNKEFYLKLFIIYVSVLLTLNLLIENRVLFFQIPGSNIFRHISRNLVIIILICYLSLAYFFSRNLENKFKLILMTFIIFIMIFPWIHKSKNENEAYNLKEFKIPKYLKTLDEEINSKFTQNERILKIPLGLSKKYESNENKFDKSYNEINDVFGLWSEVPSLSSRDTLDYLEENLIGNYHFDKININGILIDKQFNEFRINDFFLIESLKKTGHYNIVRDNNFFTLYEKKIKTPLLFIRNESNEYIKLYFQRISPVKINLLASIPKNQILELNFLENYNSAWRLNIFVKDYDMKSSIFEPIKNFQEFNVFDTKLNLNLKNSQKITELINDGQKINKFLIDAKNICSYKNLTCKESEMKLLMQLNFKLQNYFIIGSVISILYLFSVFSILFLKLRKKNV